jgi:hypothetical protein
MACAWLSFASRQQTQRTTARPVLVDCVVELHRGALTALTGPGWEC